MGRPFHYGINEHRRSAGATVGGGNSFVKFFFILVAEAWDMGTYNPGTAALLRKLEKLRDSYEKKEETSSMNSRYLFNKILNELGDFNTRLFQAGKMPLGCEKK